MTEPALLKHLEKHGHATALIDGSNTYSFAALCTKATATAAFWKKTSSLSVKMVALPATASFDFFVNLLALACCGAVVVPYPHKNQLNESGVNGYVDFWLEQGRLLPGEAQPHPLAEVLQGSPGLLLTTSGSSGRPKIVLHRLGLLLDKYMRLQQPFTSVLVYSLDHVSGLETALSILSPGGCIVCCSAVQPAVVASLVKARRATLLSCSPSFLRLLLYSGFCKNEWLGSLQKINTGAEPMDETLLQKLRNELPSVQINQAYGTTETSNLKTATRPGSAWFKPGENGIDFKVIGGELMLKKTASWVGNIHVLDGEMQVQPAPEWYATGDEAEQDSDGYIRIRCRKHEYINVGGEKVHPAEVEAVLMQFPDVLDAAVSGQANALLGQLVSARLVVADLPADPVAFKQAIRNYCRQQIAEHKIPQRIHLQTEPLLTIRLKKQ